MRPRPVARPQLPPQPFLDERPTLEMAAVSVRAIDPAAVERARVRMRSLRRLEDDQTLVSRLREQLLQLLPVDWVELFAVDSSQQLRRLGAGESDTFGYEGSSLEQVIRERRAQICGALGALALPGDETAVKTGMVSCLRVPLMVQEELVGVLVAYSRSAGTYDQHAEHSIALVTDLVAHLVLQRHLRETETSLRRWQAQMTAHDKLTSLGQLAAGMAHEINNPAAYVSANLQHARDLLTDHRPELVAGRLGDIADELTRTLSEAAEGMQRIRSILGDLRLFSRGAEHTIEAVNINSIVRAVLNLSASEVASRADVQLDLQAVPEIAGNRSRISQILLNLVRNAAQACPEERREHNRIFIQTRWDQDCVEVLVSDNGEGIPASVQPRIFEPFFTTKAPGEGAGLGLAVSRQIARSLDGQLRFETTPGAGTTFALMLPLKPPPSIEQPSSGRIVVAPVARPVVLLVDDEDGIRKALTRALSRSCEVQAVETADRAIGLLGTGLTPEIVISDLLLPGKSGADLYAFVEQRRPELVRRVLFLTGGAISPAARDFVQAHPNCVLPKPVDVRRLRTIITSVAAGASVAHAIRDSQSGSAGSS